MSVDSDSRNRPDHFRFWSWFVIALTHLIAGSNNGFGFFALFGLVNDPLRSFWAEIAWTVGLIVLLVVGAIAIGLSPGPAPQFNWRYYRSHLGLIVLAELMLVLAWCGNKYPANNGDLWLVFVESNPIRIILILDWCFSLLLGVFAWRGLDLHLKAWLKYRQSSPNQS